MEKRDFEERYQTGDLPWDIGERDRNLEEIIRDYSISPCYTLEIGAGTGSDSIWLAQKGFKVTALDLSPTAIEMARKKTADAGVDIKYVLADVLNDNIPDGPFDLVVDRGCFHVFHPPEDRKKLAEIIWNHLNSDGYWFSIIGSTDGPDRDEGPPRRSIHDIASAVESKFEIIVIKSIYLHTNLPEPPRGWACLFKKRRTEND